MLAVVLAISGAILSVDPALERLGAVVSADGRISVAVVAGRLQHYPAAEQIQRTRSGAVIVYYNRNGQVGADCIDSRSGQVSAPASVRRSRAGECRWQGPAPGTDRGAHASAATNLCVRADWSAARLRESALSTLAGIIECPL